MYVFGAGVFIITAYYSDKHMLRSPFIIGAFAVILIGESSLLAFEWYQ